MWLTSHLKSGGERGESQGTLRPLEISPLQQASMVKPQGLTGGLAASGTISASGTASDWPFYAPVTTCFLWGSAHIPAIPATLCLLCSWRESKAFQTYKNAWCQAVKWSPSSVLPQGRHFYVTILGWHFDVNFWTHSSVSKGTCEHFFFFFQLFSLTN